MKKTILILGAEGMLGRSIYKYFAQNSKFIIYGTSRGKNHKTLIQYDFPKNNNMLETFLSDKKVDFIINCIGVLKETGITDYKSNYLLPKFLDKINNKYKFKVIQISSDAVFKDSSNNVSELDKPNPDNKYGTSKLKGEICSDKFINIRSSFVGYDPKDKKGLLELTSNTKSKKINGFINQNWNGSTSLQFAKFCKYLITSNNFDNLRVKTSVLHFTPLGPITKFELLKSISLVLNLDKQIIEKESNKITRNLYSVFFDRQFLKSYTTEINSALAELKRFEYS